jgi:hypothetical protein
MNNWGTTRSRLARREYRYQGTRSDAVGPTDGCSTPSSMARWLCRRGIRLHGSSGRSTIAAEPDVQPCPTVAWPIFHAGALRQSAVLLRGNPECLGVRMVSTMTLVSLRLPRNMTGCPVVGHLVTKRSVSGMGCSRPYTDKREGYRRPTVWHRFCLLIREVQRGKDICDCAYDRRDNSCKHGNV